MKRLVLFALGTSILAGPAMAADVVYDQPAATQPMALAPIESPRSWTGIYIGGQAGAAFSSNDSGARFRSPDSLFKGGVFGGDDEDTSFIGGGHIGYDYQFGNNVVLGAVADINGVDGKTNRTYRTPGGSTFETSSEINYLGSVRARLGYSVDNLLFYGSGGLAYAGTDNKAKVDGSSSGELANYDFDKDTDDTDVGYSVGGGVDVLATQNISFGVEYLYTNLGSNDQTVTGRNRLTGDTVSFTSKSEDKDLDFHTVWAKASYHFN